MKVIEIPILILITFFFINNFFVKKKFLLSQTGEKHQKFAEKNSIPMSLGIIFFLILFYIFFKNHNYYILFFIILFFILGIFSDIKFIKSPIFRLVLQLILIIFVTKFFNFKINNIRISGIDIFLQNSLINIIFTSSCILILANGNNFIDGLNGLVLLLYLIILSFLQFNNLIDFLSPDLFLIIYILMICSLMINFSNIAYLGENGIYILTILFSYLIINSYSLNPKVSPYFYVLLLWYPAFENLFSIVRKFQLKKSPIKPDNNHFHQLLMFFIKSKIKIKNLYINNLSSIIINTFNFIFIFLGSKNIFSTKLQVILIFIYSLIYSLVYLKLFIFKFKKS